jgi:transcriptional regulator with XRE-family HTH domain
MTGPVLLKRYLKKKRLTQSDFAAQAGVSEPSVSLWLSGTYPPSGPSAMLIQSATAGAVPFAAWFPKPRGRGT